QPLHIRGEVLPDLKTVLVNGHGCAILWPEALHVLRRVAHHPNHALAARGHEVLLKAENDQTATGPDGNVCRRRHWRVPRGWGCRSIDANPLRPFDSRAARVELDGEIIGGEIGECLAASIRDSNVDEHARDRHALFDTLLARGWDREGHDGRHHPKA